MSITDDVWGPEQDAEPARSNEKTVEPGRVAEPPAQPEPPAPPEPARASEPPRPAEPSRPGEQRREAAPKSDGQFDRTPPQDVAAEQCVLGGMMLSKDAIADVVEIVRTGDFYRPMHATIFDTIIDLYGRGEPADMITVAAALTDSGDIARIGGAPYLHTLISSVPTAANSSYYGRIVSERAVLRRLIEAGTRIVQLGYGTLGGGGRDTDDLVDLAQQAVYDITERRVSEDFVRLEDLLQPTLDEIESVGAQGDAMTGIPTGFTDLDRLLNGLHSGQLIIVAGRPGLGKALALDTPLATPDGWTTMAEIAVGDQLLGADGRPTRVTAATEIMRDRRCFEVEFSDGSVIVADAEHRWLTHDRASRRRGRAPLVRTTDEIHASVRTKTADQRANHSVTNTRPLVLPERTLAVSPYTLGIWLGDGHAGSARLTVSDPAIVAQVELDGFEVRGERVCTISRAGDPIDDDLAALSVLGDKHIPRAYLRASEAQRRALLAGLLDSDGTVSLTGNVQYTSTCARLASDVFELVVSLGYRASKTTKRVQGHSEATSTAFTINFSSVDDVFRLERKKLTHKDRRRAVTAVRSGSRFIVSVRPVASVPVRCVTVANADHLYLAGRAMIPTHNSTAAMDFARSCSVSHNMASAIFSLEMSKVEIVTRLLSAEARVPLHTLRSGQLSDDDWSKLARRMGEISEAPLFVDDTPNMNLMEIRAKARRLKQRHDLKLVVVDYLQLMSSPKKTESRQQEVAELSRGLKLLAKEIQCPVIAVSQLNRGPEQRTDKRPQLSDLRESGSIEQDADVVILLHRDDYYDKESPRAGEADFIVAKHRNGPTDTITVAAQLHLSRFVDMAIV
jgi:replicative DNA helicase